MKQQTPSRVFVTQQPRPNRHNWVPNLESATQYGRLEYVFSGSESAYCDPDGAFSKALQRLQTFRPDLDYILWPSSGDPATTWAVMLALSRLAQVSHIRILYWERSLVDGHRSQVEGFYTPITFQLPKTFFAPQQRA